MYFKRNQGVIAIKAMPAITKAIEVKNPLVLHLTMNGDMNFRRLSQHNSWLEQHSLSVGALYMKEFALIPRAITGADHQLARASAGTCPYDRSSTTSIIPANLFARQGKLSPLASLKTSLMPSPVISSSSSPTT